METQEQVHADGPTLERIVVATDLSADAQHALDRGIEVAHQTSAQLTVVHALGLDALGLLRNLIGAKAPDVAAQVAQHQHQALDALARERARQRRVAVRVRVEEGLATDVIAQVARDCNADLLLMGARGEHPLQRLLIGSTASRLLRKSECPVLVIKNPPSGPYRQVLVAVDFSVASERALRMARALAPAAALTVLHVFDVPFEAVLHYASVSEDTIHAYRIQGRERALTRLHELIRRAGLAPSGCAVEVEHGDAARVIVDKAARQRCDLLVMGKHGTHVTEELLLGSVTRRVLSESDADMLVVVDPQSAPEPLI